MMTLKVGMVWMRARTWVPLISQKRLSAIEDLVGDALAKRARK